MARSQDLPEVLAVEMLEGQHAARVRVEGGRVVFLSPDMTPRASFLPSSAATFPALLEDWQAEDSPTYRVPASLTDALARVFDMGEEEAHALHPAKKKPLSSVKNVVSLPTVVDVEALPEGAARLHLADGQSVEVPDASDSHLSPDEYAPALLSFSGGLLEGRSFIVPDALRLSVMAALGYAPPVQKTPPTVYAGLLEGPGRALLAVLLDGLHFYPYRLTLPVRFDLAGLRSEALKGKPYTLTLFPGTPEAVRLFVPFDAWPDVARVLSGEKEAQL